PMFDGIKSMAKNAGRDPSALELIVGANVEIHDTPIEKDRVDFTGTLEQIAEDVAMNEAMRCISLTMTPAVTAAYEWSHFPVVADIGGGIGTQLVSILNASPSSRGILFDQPRIGSKPIYHSRMEVIAGDFFESVPTGADAYLLRWILHDW